MESAHEAKLGYKIKIRAFKKIATSDKVGTFHSYVTQFPFRGHDSWDIQDEPANKQKALADLRAFEVDTDVFKPKPESPRKEASGEPTYASPKKTVDLQRQMRHPKITDDMIKRNPFVFALNQAKLKDMHRESQQSSAPGSSAAANFEVKVTSGFDYFNKRTEFPFDLVENPMRIDPAAEDPRD